MVCRSKSLPPTLTLNMVIFLMLVGCADHRIASGVVSPPSAAPRASLIAGKVAISRGEATRLFWSTQNAKSVTISGIGKVSDDGFWAVTPKRSTTYILTATGPGGTCKAAVRVVVNALITQQFSQEGKAASSCNPQ